MAERKQFKSVLDYRPQFEDITDALVPDIEFSYSAIMNNATVQTYFNMLSLEYYGYEYHQILRMNNLDLKLSDRVLNLTILEMVYNIVTQLVARKWRYSEYIAYDMYILPLRIKKYVNAMNYKFIETETADKLQIWKLVSAGTRAITEDFVDTYHDDRINNIIALYRASVKSEQGTKLNLIKNLAPFIFEAQDLMFQQFGTEFAENYLESINYLTTLRSDDLKEKDVKFIDKNADRLFDVAILVLLLMSDAMKAGVWNKIKADEKRRLELEDTQKTIEEANRRLAAIKEQAKAPEKKAVAKKAVKK